MNKPSCVRKPEENQEIGDVDDGFFELPFEIDPVDSFRRGQKRKLTHTRWAYNVLSNAKMLEGHIRIWLPAHYRFEGFLKFHGLAIIGTHVVNYDEGRCKSLRPSTDALKTFRVIRRDAK